MNGKVWDLARPLEEDCKLELVDWSDPDGKDVRALPPVPCSPFTRFSSLKAVQCGFAVFVLQKRALSRSLIMEWLHCYSS